MARYVDIECDSVTEVINRRAFKSRNDIQDFLDNIPTADVQEVKHGEWVIDDFTNILKCSLCDIDAPISTCSGVQYESNYCPTCGAKMDGGKNE